MPLHKTKTRLRRLRFTSSPREQQQQPLVVQIHAERRGSRLIVAAEGRGGDVIQVQRRIMLSGPVCRISSVPDSSSASQRARLQDWWLDSFPSYPVAAHKGVRRGRTGLQRRSESKKERERESACSRGTLQRVSSLNLCRDISREPQGQVEGLDNLSPWGSMGNFREFPYQPPPRHWKSLSPLASKKRANSAEKRKPSTPPLESRLPVLEDAIMSRSWVHAHDEFKRKGSRGSPTDALARNFGGPSDLTQTLHGETSEIFSRTRSLFGGMYSRRVNRTRFY